MNIKQYVTIQAWLSKFQKKGIAVLPHPFAEAESQVTFPLQNR